MASQPLNRLGVSFVIGAVVLAFVHAPLILVWGIILALVCRKRKRS